MTFDEAPSATISRQREHKSAMPSRQREYAEWRMKNSQQYVSKVLMGQENLSLETMSKIEACLGVQFCPHPRFRALHPLVIKRLTDCLGQGELQYHYVASQEGRKEILKIGKV